MASSLYTALSALNAHQSWLDVIGNNLANTNTPGFKSAAATFGEAFSRSLRPAMSARKAGGTNPMQIYASGAAAALSYVSWDGRWQVAWLIEKGTWRELKHRDWLAACAALMPKPLGARGSVRSG